MSETNICKNCGHHFVGKYCNNCGEKVYTKKDRSVKHILSEGLHFITHFDGTLLTTLKAFFTKPGQISLDYCDGKRKQYFKPLSFFLLLVILYLLFPVFEGLNMQLHYHQIHDLYGGYATAKIHSVMVEKNLTFIQLSEAFHHAGEKTSKFLLFIIIPIMALFSWGIGYKKRNLYFDNFIFTIEISSVYILWGFLILPFITALFRWMTGHSLFANEGQVGLAILIVFIPYIAIAAKRFFPFRWWYAIIYSLLYTAMLIIVIEYIYKFILFNIAINMVH